MIGSSIKRFCNYMHWLYMQYLLNTALYMLEPSEVRVFNVLVLVVLATCVYSTYVFLPSQLMRIAAWWWAASGIVGDTSSSSSSPSSSNFIQADL